MFDASAVAEVGAGVAVVTEVIKRSMPEQPSSGPYISLTVSLVFSIIFAFSSPDLAVSRELAWALLQFWINVFISSTGVYHGTKLTLRRFGA